MRPDSQKQTASRRPRAAACLLGALLPLLAHAAEPPVLPARAVTVDDEAIEGALIALDATPTVELRVEGQARRIPCSDLLALELRRGRPAPSRDDAAIVLRNGDCLRGVIQGGSGRAVAVRSAVFGTLECPLQAIARIELPAPQPAAPLQAAEKRDRLLFRNNESIEGTLESLGAAGVKFRSEALGQLEVGFDRLAAIALAAHGDEAPKPPDGVVAIAHADDGTVVSGQVRRTHAGSLELAASFGAGLALRLDRLLSIEFRGGRLVYLSDIEPAEAKETPFFDLVWHYRRDRSVDGAPLRIGDRAFAKGLGVHSRCELTYALDGRCRRFLADVGLDEEVGEKGNVDVAVLVDGKVKFERKGLTGRGDAVPVAVDLAGASRLTLVVDFGQGFDICDHLDWANARLIR